MVNLVLFSDEVIVELFVCFSLIMATLFTPYGSNTVQSFSVSTLGADTCTSVGPAPQCEYLAQGFNLDRLSTDLT